MVPAALTRDIDLGFEGPETAEVAADPILLAELLRNLVSNADHLCRAWCRRDRAGRREGPARSCWRSKTTAPAFLPTRSPPSCSRGADRRGPCRICAKGQANGMGLGLAVAVEIANLFKADLQLEKARSGSGLLASITFRTDAG